MNLKRGKRKKEGGMKGRRGEIMRCTMRGFHGNFAVTFIAAALMFTRTCDKVTFVLTQAGGALHATRGLTQTTTQPTDSRRSLAKPLGLFLTQARRTDVLPPGSSRSFGHHGGRGLYWNRKNDIFLWQFGSEPTTSAKKKLLNNI